jgi:hypothetical protein
LALIWTLQNDRFGHLAGIGDQFLNDRFRGKSHYCTREEHSHHWLSVTQTKQFQTTNRTRFRIRPQAADRPIRMFVPPAKQSPSDRKCKRRADMFAVEERQKKWGRATPPHYAMRPMG